VNEPAAPCPLGPKGSEPSALSPEPASSRPELVASRPEPSPVSSEPRAPSTEPALSRPEPTASRPGPIVFRPEPSAPNPVRFTIVTPSYNQGKYLEKTILSVLEQGYPNLEYIIIDGGSTDESVAIIKKYADRLAYWVSEPDRGQSHAINKGFERATGDIFGWLNSDDWYHPGALQAVAEAFASNPEAGAVVGAGEYIDETGAIINLSVPNAISLESIYSWFDEFFWQPSCFFTRETWGDCGPLDESLVYAMDLDLWIKMAKKYQFAAIETLLSTSLKHPDAKTTAQAHESDLAAMEIIISQGGEEGFLTVLDCYTRRLLGFEQYYLELLANRDQQLAERDYRLAVRDSQLAERDSHLADREKLVAIRENEVAECVRQIMAMQNSLSWRVTKLLRWLGDLIKAAKSKGSIE